MQAIKAIGLDIAKSVFQVHGIDAEDNVIIHRQLKRRYVLAFFQKLPLCLIGIEACAGIVTPLRACGPAGGSVAKGMKKISYRGYRFPPEFQQAIWLY